MEKKSSSCSFLFSEDCPSFAAPNACSDALSSSSAIAKANSNTDAPPPTVETQEVDLTSHDPQNPPSPPHVSTSFSSRLPTIVTQGGSSGSSNAATTISVAGDGEFQGMPSSPFSVQTASVLREGMKDMMIRATDLIVETLYHALLSN